VLGIDSYLPSITPASRDDAAIQVAVRPHPVREDDCKVQAVREADRDEAAFTVIPSTVLDDDSGAIENQRRERESALSQVGCALGRVPRVPHHPTLQTYIQFIKPA